MSKRIRIVVLLISVLAVSLNVTSQHSSDTSGVLVALTPAIESIRGDRILEHIKILASDKFEGRNTGSKGEILTVNYLVDQFKRAGLKPGNPDGTYIQKVPLVGFLSQPQIELSINGTKLPLNFMDDFVHEYPRLQPHVSVKNAGVVFAGYGIVAPEYGWDDYKGVDVRNKLVILLGSEPSFQDKNDPSKTDNSMFRGDDRTVYSTGEVKNEIALKKGAAAVLFITDPSKSNSFSIFQTFASLEGLLLRPKAEPRAELAMDGLLTIDAARRIFKACGEDFEKLRTFAGKGDFKPVSTNALANISIKTKLRNVMSQNVVARLDGSDPQLKSEYLIYTAHWDHLGIDKSLKGDQIYNGAIDNAIGTASLVEMSKAFAKVQPRLKRSVLFIATTGEEKAYLGARYYVQNPLFPLKKTIANINLDGGDAWGRTRDAKLGTYGLSTLDEEFETAAKLQGRTFIRDSVGDGGLYFSSDNIEFAKAGIPAAFPFGGFDFVDQPADFGYKKWADYSGQ